MSSFDPDAYLAKKKSFDPDAYLGSKNKVQEVMSEAASAVGGALENFSLGLRDELSGGIEALGSKVGLRGLGGPLSGIRLETPEEDKQSFADVYEQGKQEKRNLIENERNANPNAFLAGELVSGFALPATKAKGALDIAKRGALLSGVTGFGKGEGLEDSLANAASGAATGAVLPVAMNKLAKSAGAGINRLGEKFTGKDSPSRDALARKTSRIIGGVPEEQTQRYIDRNAQVRDAIKSGKKIEDIADSLGEKLSDVRSKLSKASTESYNILAKNDTKISRRQASAILGARIKKLKESGFSDAELDSDIGFLSRFKQQALEQPETQIEGKKIKTLLTLMDKKLEKAYADNPSYRNSIGERGLLQARGKLNKVLRKKDPEYAAKMKEISERVGTAKDATKRFGKPEQGMNQLKRIGRENNPYGERVLQSFDKKEGTDFVDQTKDLLTGQIMNAQSTQGSRNVNFGRSVGRFVGLGTDLGETIGAGAGYAADKFGRTGVAKAIDWSLISRRLSPKYQQALQSGAQRGGNAASVNHYLLYQKDPAYREEFDRAQSEGEN
jgi:hypothetical protein